MIAIGSERAPIASPETWRYQADITCGDFDTEADSVAALDIILDEIGLFDVRREVRGQHLQPRPGQEAGKPRIDRLLIPSALLIERGWPHGVIGIECKRTGEKVGRPISQMIDYSRSAFTVDGGVMVIPSYVLLWPWTGPYGGPPESIIVQQRLGWACPATGLFEDGLRLMSGPYNALASFVNGDFTFPTTESRSGRKVGSR